MVDSAVDRQVRLKGLIPALDNRQRGEKGILAGKNFMLDAEGPYSAFGTDLITYQKIANPKGNATFRVEDDIFHFTQGAVLAYDSNAGYYYPVFTFTDSGDIFPWSHAVVGGVHYFARKGVGLLQYTPTTNVWSTLSGGSVPDGVVSVDKKADRLIVLGSTVVAWSAISDGSNLTTDITTGAGFQALSLIGGGDPYAVKAVVDGFIVSTANGSMKGLLVSTEIPFKFDPLDEEAHIPINPFCVVSFGTDRVLFLTKTGFVITQGRPPESWQPLMGEYFIQKVLPRIDLTLVSVIALHYNHDRQWLFISVGSDTDPQVYTHAFGLYIPRDEWGRIDHIHTGFGELNIVEGSDSGFNFGYIGSDGCIHSFNDVNRVESIPVFTEIDMLRHLTHEIPGRYEGTTLVTATNMNLTSSDRNQYQSIYGPEPDFTPTQASIDSFIDVGLFSFPEGRQAVEESVIHDITVGMNTSVEVTEEDWNELTGEEDWNTLSGEEDWGFNFQGAVQYDIDIIPTLDGINAFEDQTLNAVLIEEKGAVRYYDTGGSLAPYHIIRVKALSTDQSFHLKLLEPTGILVGRE